MDRTKPVLRRYLGSAWDEAPIGGVIVGALVLALALFKLQGFIAIGWWLVFAPVIAVMGVFALVLLAAWIVMKVEGK